MATDFATFRWKKIGERSSGVQQSLHYAYAIGKDFSEVFNVEAIHHQLYIFDGKTTAFYFPEEEYQSFSSNYQRRLQNASAVATHADLVMSACAKGIRQAKRLEQKVSSTISDDILLTIFHDYEALWRFFYVRAWSMFFMPVIEDLVSRGLHEHHSDEEVSHALNIISQPTLLTPIISQEIAFLELGRDLPHLSRNELQARAELMAERFGWMSVYNLNDVPRTAEYYMETVKGMVPAECEQKIRDMAQNRADSEKKYQSIYEALPGGLLKEQVGLLHVAGYLRDTREEARDRMVMGEKAVYQELARRSGFSMPQITNLTTQEIDTLFTRPGVQMKFSSLADARLHTFCMTVEEQQAAVVENEEQRRALVNSVISSVAPASKTLTGRVAYKGEEVIRGRVSIIRNNQDVRKVQEGDILVASMTRPDYVPAMKRAAAFITDEGGLLSHAAIVAREMKKPCIIGTQHATQLLQDGDMVEVDTGSGKVIVQ